MISGRYRSDDLCKYWSLSNKLGHCLAPTCQGAGVVGDLEHILVECPALHETRERLKQLWLDRSKQSPAFYQMINMVLSSPPSVQVQFILDPTVFDGTAMLAEIYGYPFLTHVHYLTRTYAYYIHRQRLIVLDKWPGDFGRNKKAPLNNNFHANHDSSSGLAKSTINSVFAGYPTSQCVSVSTRASSSMINTMTGTIAGNNVIDTLDSSRVPAQLALPANPALHNVVRPSIVSASVPSVVTDTTPCYSSTLLAYSSSSAVIGSCAQQVVSVSECRSSVISQLKL